MRMPPRRYAPWMARDAAVRPGLVCLVIAGLFSFLFSRLPATVTDATARDFLTRTVAQLDWLVVLVATAGMVSWDRASGFYRSLFSQPVHPGLYYLQRWLLGGVAVAALVPLLGLGILLVSGILPYSGPLLARLLLKYLLLGGLTFALSTLLRADWMIAFLVSILQSVLHTLAESGVALGTPTRVLLRLLPPFHLASGTGVPLSYPSGPELTYALLYGAGVLALALLLVTLRPLGSGGRA